MDSPLGSPAAAYVSVTAGVAVALICRLGVESWEVVWVPGVVTFTVGVTGPLITQPSLEFDHRDCTANVPVDSVMLPAGSVSPQIDPAQAHLSPISPPLTLSLRSMYPLLGTGSVIASAYSWPPTVLNPSHVPPGFIQSSPQLPPASSW